MKEQLIETIFHLLKPSRALTDMLDSNVHLDEHRSRQREVRERDKGDKVLGIQRHLFVFDWLEIFNFFSKDGLPVYIFK